MTEHGPIYGVELIDTLPIPGSGMFQKMPTREDLEKSRTYGDRVAAGYEIALQRIAQLEAERDKDKAFMQLALEGLGLIEGQSPADNADLEGIANLLKSRLSESEAAP